MKKVGIMMIVLGVLLLALHVQAQPEKILEDYRPGIDLSLQVMAMLELEQTTELVFSTEQATVLLPLLGEFQSKKTMTNDEATAYQEQLTETVLTPEQCNWVTTRSDELFTELFNESEKPPVGFGLGMRLMSGEKVNLVKDGPSKESLAELVSLLGAKATQE
ncbi:MAG: hypothetical protein ACRCYY_05240 [Trueperaceae bacterium]